MTVRALVGPCRLAVAHVATAMVVSVLVSSVAWGQSSPEVTDVSPDWTPPLPAWGAPDLQGVWDYRTMTPLQRPREFADQSVFTDEQAAAYQARTLEQQADYDRSPSVHAKWWLDYGKELTDDNRTSLIVDPPTGRIPPTTEEARERSAARAARRRAHPADAAEYRSNSERCLTFGTPRLPGAYNNNYQILQTPSHVVIVSEMIHDTRVVPLDGRPVLTSNVVQWHGDSRGRWEGNTLVVESANYSIGGAFRGATEGLRLVERFTRVGPDTIHYEITADDSATWISPWTLMFPMVKTDQPMYEYACHEGNHGLENILGNARFEDRTLRDPAPAR